MVDSSDRLLPYVTHVGSSNTPSRCVAHCRSRGYIFSGVQSTGWCLCGNTAPPSSKLVPMNQCNERCPGDSSKLCGGQWRMNVVAVPWDGQCVVDTANSIASLLPHLKWLQSRETALTCVAYCRSIGYLFSGVKNGNECRCGNSAPPSSKVAPKDQCNKPCPGDSSQMCGASSRMNVYGTTADCGSSWKQLGSHCYNFFGEKLTWTAAQARCVREGGHLASVQSLEENQFLDGLRRLDSSSEKTVWIGGTDIDAEGSWLWSDGSAWKYTNWHSEEPNNSGGSEDCVQIREGGEWNDDSCSKTRTFICEKQGLISYVMGCSGGDSCCTDTARCGYGEGDCDSDNDCQHGLGCGRNNCRTLNPTLDSFDSTDDCCA